ncbi:hypothetical protein [Acinetobacter baumannii]
MVSLLSLIAYRRYRK